MPTENAFLEAIRAEPDVDVHRLAFADWLAEGDDVHARERGEFVRVQCELARMAEDDPRRLSLAEREAELLRLHQKDWTDRAFVRWLSHPKKACRCPEGHAFCKLMARGIAARCDLDDLPPNDPGRKRLERAVARHGRKMEDGFTYTDATCTSPFFEECTFRRGFIESASVEWWMVYLFAEAVFDLTVVRHLTIEDEYGHDVGDNAVLGLCRALSRGCLLSLDVVSTITRRGTLRTLVECPHLRSLEKLDLFVPDNGDESAKTLAGSPHLHNLRFLSVSCFGTITDAGLVALLDSPYLAGLTELKLDVEHQRFSPELRSRFEERFGPA